MSMKSLHFLTAVAVGSAGCYEIGDVENEGVVSAQVADPIRCNYVTNTLWTTSLH